MYDAQEDPGYPESAILHDQRVLYGLITKYKAVAIDAITGKFVWTFDSGIDARGSNCGASYWESGDDHRILASVKSFIYAPTQKLGK